MILRRLLFLFTHIPAVRSQQVEMRSTSGIFNFSNSSRSLIILPDNNPYLEELINKTRMTILISRPLEAISRKEYGKASKGKERNNTNYRDPNQRKKKVDSELLPIGEINIEPIQRNKRSTKFRTETSSEGHFRLEPEESKLNFSMVGGYEEVKSELKQVIDFLLTPEKYTIHGVRLPRGLLLEGPPGNGKTLLARALAGETNSSFIVAVGSEFTEKYVGVGASRVRELFDLAKMNLPCIMFIDELDALGKKRSGSGEGADSERDQTLNQLLVALDGFQSSDRLLVMAATNRVDILDKALLRPGRFDKIVTVPNPDLETRKAIISIHIRNKPINISIDTLAEETAGFSGAMIEGLLNEATLLAIRNGSLPVTDKAVEKIRDRMIIGQMTTRRKMSSVATRRIAIHEIGHLLMSLKSKYHEKPRKVSVDTSSPSSLGFTMFEKDDVDSGIFLREYLEDKLQVLLGGRVAEEVIFGLSVSSGALSDLESAFNLAKLMVMQYGMGNKIIYPYFSEQYKKEIDDEIHLLINRAYKDSKKTLEENRLLLVQLADTLIVKKVMMYEEIVDFMKSFNSR